MTADLEIRDIEKAIDKVCLWQPTSFECVTFLADRAYQWYICGRCKPNPLMDVWYDVSAVSAVACADPWYRVHLADAMEFILGSRVLRVRYGQCERCSAVYYALLGYRVPINLQVK